MACDSAHAAELAGTMGLSERDLSWSLGSCEVAPFLASGSAFTVSPTTNAGSPLGASSVLTAALSATTAPRVLADFAATPRQEAEIASPLLAPRPIAASTVADASPLSAVTRTGIELPLASHVPTSAAISTPPRSARCHATETRGAAGEADVPSILPHGSRNSSIDQPPDGGYHLEAPPQDTSSQLPCGQHSSENIRSDRQSPQQQRHEKLPQRTEQSQSPHHEAFMEVQAQQIADQLQARLQSHLPVSSPPHWPSDIGGSLLTQEPQDVTSESIKGLEVKWKGHLEGLKDSFQEELAEWAAAQRTLEVKVNRLRDFRLSGRVEGATQAPLEEFVCSCVRDAVASQFEAEFGIRRPAGNERDVTESAGSTQEHVVVGRQHALLSERLAKIEALLGDALEGQTRSFARFKESLRDELHERLWEYHGAIQNPCAELGCRMDHVERILGDVAGSTVGQRLHQLESSLREAREYLANIKAKEAEQLDRSGAEELIRDLLDRQAIDLAQQLTDTKRSLQDRFAEQVSISVDKHMHIAEHSLKLELTHMQQQIVAQAAAGAKSGTSWEECTAHERECREFQDRLAGELGSLSKQVATLEQNVLCMFQQEPWREGQQQHHEQQVDAIERLVCAEVEKRWQDILAKESARHEHLSGQCQDWASTEQAARRLLEERLDERCSKEWVRWEHRHRSLHEALTQLGRMVEDVRSACPRQDQQQQRQVESAGKNASERLFELEPETLGDDLRHPVDLVSGRGSSSHDLSEILFSLEPLMRGSDEAFSACPPRVDATAVPEVSGGAATPLDVDGARQDVFADLPDEVRGANSSGKRIDACSLMEQFGWPPTTSTGDVDIANASEEASALSHRTLATTLASTSAPSSLSAPSGASSARSNFASTRDSSLSRLVGARIFGNAPQVLRLVSPSGHMSYIGDYACVVGEMVNGYPLWKHRAGNRWLYSGVDGKWHVGGQEVLDQKFQCQLGVIHSSCVHLGTFPDKVIGCWLRKYGASLYEDHDIEVSIVGNIVPMVPSFSHEDRVS